MPAEDTTNKNINTTIFVSHRHADNQIATVISETLKNWGTPWGDNPEQVYYSSDPSSGPKAGDTIHEDVRLHLHQEKLVMRPLKNNSRKRSVVRT